LRTPRRRGFGLSGEIVEAYLAAPLRPPSYIDLLNINLNEEDLAEAGQRIGRAWMHTAGMGPASHRTWF
jgi:hypothetical protein